MLSPAANPAAGPIPWTDSASQSKRGSSRGRERNCCPDGQPCPWMGWCQGMGSTSVRTNPRTGMCIITEQGGFWGAGREPASSRAPRSCKLDAAAVLLKLLPQHHQGAAPKTCPSPCCWLSGCRVSLRSDKIKAFVHVRPHARAHACPCLLQGHGHPHMALSLQGHRGWEQSQPSPCTAWESGRADVHPAGFPADLNFQLASCPGSFSQGTLGSSGQDGLSYQAQLNIWLREPALWMQTPVVLAARTSSSPTQRALDSSLPMSTSRAGANLMRASMLHAGDV